MRQQTETAPAEDVRTIRLAWWTSFLATVILIAPLGFVRSAQAATVPVGEASATPFLVSMSDDEEEAEGEEAEEEFEAEECEASEEFEDEEEAEELCAEELEAEAPRECVLSSASASVSVSNSNNKVRLAIRYTAFSPGSVNVAFFLRGSKGPLSLSKQHSHLSRKGVIRDTETLTEPQMGKALAAKNFTVQLRPAHAPDYCDSLLDQHLTVRHGTAGRLTWSDPGLGFRSARLG